MRPYLGYHRQITPSPGIYPESVTMRCVGGCARPTLGDQNSTARTVTKLRDRRRHILGREICAGAQSASLFPLWYGGADKPQMRTCLHSVEQPPSLVFN